MKAHIQDTLTSIIERTASQLTGVSDAELSHKDRPDKWSKKEILGHLIDSAINNHRRFKQFLHQEHLVFDGYNQDNEVVMNDYQNRPLQEIIALWSGMNQQIIQILKAIPDERFTKRYTQHNYHRIGFKRVPETEASSIQYLIQDYLGHMEHHLAQMLPDYERELAEYTNDL